jgi:hypothetical protein
VLHLENVLTEPHTVTVRDGLVLPKYLTTWQDGRDGPRGHRLRQDLAGTTVLVGSRLAPGTRLTPYPA